MTAIQTFDGPRAPLVFPCAVVIDSAEKLPFAFATIRADAKDERRPLLVPLVRGNLPCGDYSLEGMETRVAVERKSKTDLYQTLGRAHNRRKFIQYHIGPMHERYEFAAVVCEADWTELVTDPPEFTKVTPKTVFRTVMAWAVRYNRVQWFFCPGREFAEKVTFQLLEKYWRSTHVS